MTVIFEGREFARKKEEALKSEVNLLKLKPKLVTILVGNDPASMLYVSLKKKAAMRIGAEMEIAEFKASTAKEEILKLIEAKNDDASVHGIMLQLPLPEGFSQGDRDFLISSISFKKDVDGLRNDSMFVAPTAKAVLDIFSAALKEVGSENIKDIVIVGGNGFIGGQILRALKGFNNKNIRLSVGDKKTRNLDELIKRGDALISVTGNPDLIKKENVKNNAVLIDVGSPMGDIEKSAYEKASFVSPVPGGVGPVTISSLLENLVTSAKNSSEQR